MPPSNVTDVTARAYEHYYSVAYIIVGFSLSCFIFIIGLTGNVMVVMVVSRTKSMRTPTNCYLVSLAVADVILLVSAVLPSMVEYFLIVEQFLFGRVGCSLMVFLQYLGLNVSSLSITAFTIERYIAICHPLKAQSICTVERATRIIAGLWLFGCVYCAPWLLLASTSTRALVSGSSIDVCGFTLNRERYRTFYMADLVIFYVVPLLVALVLYGLIVHELFRANLITSNRGFESSRLTQRESSINGNKARKPASSGSKFQVGVVSVETTFLTVGCTTTRPSSSTLLPVSQTNIILVLYLAQVAAGLLKRHFTAATTCTNLLLLPCNFLFAMISLRHMVLVLNCTV